MKTRLIALLLVLVMVAAMLISCGETEDPAKPSGGGGDDPTPPPVIETNWWDDVDFSGKTLTISLQNYDGDSELPSGCIKYMKGPDAEQTGTSGFEKVENAVYLRNQNAMADLGINLAYSYTTEVETSDWGTIASKLKNKESGGQSTIDLYCSIQYDMMGCALDSGIFANALRFTTEDYINDFIDTYSTNPDNPIQIAEYVGGYLNMTDGNGFYEDYMSDLSLSNTRRTLIGSDYFIDVMRAMMIMPFNLGIYSELVDPGDPTAEKFYDMILDGGWTWDKLMSYDSVFHLSTKANLTTEHYLMGICTGGLVANALIYSTAFKAFDIKNNEDGTQVYTFKTVCPELGEAFVMAGNLVEVNSIVTSPTIKAGVEGVTESNLHFTSGQALFAMPNLLGIIENEEFQKMEKLSVVPVPKLANAGGREYDYSTVISSRARVGAIPVNSANKVEMSAFLQYVTENSGDMKEEYFSKAMSGRYLAGSGASPILDLIYTSIGDGKTGVIDNALRANDWNGAKAYLWTNYIQEKDYSGHKTDFSGVYTSAISAKASYLTAMINKWNAIRDGK